jgi:hypothetical protein
MSLNLKKRREITRRSLIEVKRFKKEEGRRKKRNSIPRMKKSQEENKDHIKTQNRSGSTQVDAKSKSQKCPVPNQQRRKIAQGV